MRLSERSYPHPVVGNRDDVPGAGFQASISATSDKENFYIDVVIECSSESVRSLVRERRAAYVAHVECSNTLYRQAFRFHEEAERIVIPGSRLFDKFEVNVMACVLGNVPGYTVLGAHADYGDAAFDLAEGDIIAVADGEEFLAEFEDALARIGSIMQVDESQVEDDGTMKVDWNGKRIAIILSKKDFATYSILKGLEPIGSALASTIVLPVLIQALNEVKNTDSDLTGCRWHDILQHRLKKLEVLGSDSTSSRLPSSC
jgi:hypothetical protein